MTEAPKVTQRSERHELAHIEVRDHATHETWSSQQAWITLTFIDDQVFACLAVHTHRQLAYRGINNRPDDE